MLEKDMNLFAVQVLRNTVNSITIISSVIITVGVLSGNFLKSYHLTSYFEFIQYSVLVGFLFSSFFCFIFSIRSFLHLVCNKIFKKIVLTTSRDGHIKEKLYNLEYKHCNDFGYDDLRVENIFSATNLIKRATIFYNLGLRLFYLNITICVWLILGHWGLFGSTLIIFGVFYYMDHND
jgi:hypothetical protein